MQRGRRRLQAPDSDSDSDDGVPKQIEEPLYQSLQLAAALRRPADFATAAAELAAIVRELWSSRCSKAVQAQAVQDIALSIHCCDTRLQSRSALAGLMEAVERQLPQARRKELQRLYRQSAVQMQRHERRRGAGCGAGAPTGPGSDDEQEPATFDCLPHDVMAHVLRYLDPITLARCACVSREWGAAAAANALWQRHWAALSAEPPAGSRAAATGLSSTEVCSSGGDCRRRFAALAARHPARLLRWRTNRALVGRRLGWLPDGQPGRAGCRRIDTAAVLEYLRSGGKGSSVARCLGGAGGSSSSSSDEGGGEEPPCTSQLKFWQL